MKKPLVLTVLLCLFLSLPTCDERKSHSENGYGAARPILEDIQNFLVDNRGWITQKNLSILSERSLSVKTVLDEMRQTGLAKISDSIPDIGEITIDGIMYQVHLELFNDGLLDSISGLGKQVVVEDYGVGLDPDEFESNEVDDVITIQILKDDNTLELITLKNPDLEYPYPADGEVIEMTDYEGLGLVDAYNEEIRNDLAYPVFFLTLEEEVPGGAMVNSGAQNSSPFTLHPWLEIHKINLYITHESSDPEFEMYRTDGYVNPYWANVYSSYGIEEFNGRDAENPPYSGRTIYIRNVDKPNEVFSEPYLVRRLDDLGLPADGISPDGFGLTFIESDYDAMDIWKTHNYHPPGTGYHFYKKNQRYRKIPYVSGEIHAEVYHTWGHVPNGTDDDFYMGEILGLSEANVTTVFNNSGLDYFWLPVYTDDLGRLYSDLGVMFKRGYYSY